jgi:hypothetical protein
LQRTVRPYPLDSFTHREAAPVKPPDNVFTMNPSHARRALQKSFAVLSDLNSIHESCSCREDDLKIRHALTLSLRNLSNAINELTLHSESAEPPPPIRAHDYRQLELLSLISTRQKQRPHTHPIMSNGKLEL